MGKKQLKQRIAELERQVADLEAELAQRPEPWRYVPPKDYIYTSGPYDPLKHGRPYWYVQPMRPWDITAIENYSCGTQI